MERQVEGRDVWRRTRDTGFTTDAEVRTWARRLHVTPNEMREMIEENGYRAPPRDS